MFRNLLSRLIFYCHWSIWLSCSMHSGWNNRIKHLKLRQTSIYGTDKTYRVNQAAHTHRSQHRLTAERPLTSCSAERFIYHLIAYRKFSVLFFNISVLYMFKHFSIYINYKHWYVKLLEREIYFIHLSFIFNCSLNLFICRWMNYAAYITGQTEMIYVTS